MGTEIEAANLAAERFGWDKQHRAVALDEYRKFVTLVAAHPNEQLVPCVDVDSIWHEHEAIASRAEAVPAHTTHSTSDSVERYRLTLKLYEESFGRAGDLWVTAAECQVRAPTSYSKAAGCQVRGR